MSDVGTIRVVDSETTGIEPPPANGLVEVGWIDLVRQTPERWVAGAANSTLINPLRPIPPEASGVHHIVDQDVVDAPTWMVVKPDLYQGLGDDPVFAMHHAKFDQSFLELKGRVICTWKVAVKLWPDAPNWKNQTLRYYLGLKLAAPQLATPHRAAGDVYVTAAILARAFYQFDTTVDELVKFSSEPVLMNRFLFGKHAMARLDARTESGAWLVPTDYLDWVAKNITDDEDVLFTAKSHLQARNTANRNRSPVTADPPKKEAAP